MIRGHCRKSCGVCVPRKWGAALGEQPLMDTAGEGEGGRGGELRDEGCRGREARGGREAREAKQDAAGKPLPADQIVVWPFNPEGVRV